MGVSGIPSRTWDETEEKTGFSIVPAGHGLDFEITEVREGRSQKGDEYVMPACVYYDDDGQKFVQWEYFSLDAERLGFYKAFLMGVGRADLMHENADWQELLETRFQSDVVHRNYKGEMKANLVYTTLIPVSHDCVEIPKGEAVEEPEPETQQSIKDESQEVADKPKQRKPAPRRSPRPRTAR
jgi:hypothetical protein